MGPRRSKENISPCKVLYRVKRIYSVGNQVGDPEKGEKGKKIGCLINLTHKSVITLVYHVCEQGDVYDCLEGDLECGGKSDGLCEVLYVGIIKRGSVQAPHGKFGLNCRHMIGN